MFAWNFCVLYHWSCSFGQRYMVSGVETHRLHLLPSTNWSQVYENVSYCELGLQTTWRIDRLSRFAGFHLTFLDSTASCDSAYLTSHRQIGKVNRKSKITAGCCFLFSEESQHATEARSWRRRNRPGIWSPHAAQTSTNPNKYSTTVQIRAQRKPSY